MESPRGQEGVISHYILSQKMMKKILALELKGVNFNIQNFKDIYAGVALEMSMDRLERLQSLTDETEIVNFLRKKGNNPDGGKGSKGKLPCEESSSPS